MRAIVRPANLTQSRGIALIAGLLLMASMVVLALAVATGMLLERRMAANFSDAQLALQRAQLADKWAGYWLLSRPNNPLDPACNDSCGPSPPLFGSGQLPDPPELEDTGWWQLHAQIAGIEPVTGQVQMDYSLPGTEDASSRAASQLPRPSWPGPGRLNSYLHSIRLLRMPSGFVNRSPLRFPAAAWAGDGGADLEKKTWLPWFYAA
jgi:hypothetical protein